jgi:hypothetical protein
VPLKDAEGIPSSGAYLVDLVGFKDGFRSPVTSVVNPTLKSMQHLPDGFPFWEPVWFLHITYSSVPL